MELSKVIFVLFFAYLAAPVMGKRVAGLVVFRRVDSRIEYLMLKPSKANKEWSPPKGRIDEGENAFEAALRETKEEVNFSPEDLNIYPQHYQQLSQLTKTKKKMKTLDYYLAELKNPQQSPQLSHEHSEYRWLTKDEIKSVLDHPDFIELIKSFESIAKTL